MSLNQRQPKSITTSINTKQNAEYGPSRRFPSETLASATTLIHGTRDNSSVSSISQPALMLPANPELRQKLVIVGDGACGKTALLLVCTKGSMPETIQPTIFDNYVHDFEVDAKHVELQFWDTSGLDDYDKLRPLCYPDSHVVLICFAVDSPDSLDSVQEKWISEVLHFCSGVLIILVGLKKDLRHDPKTIEKLHKSSQKPISYEQGAELAKKIGAYKYLECSALTTEGVTEVFLHAARAAVLPRKKKKEKRENKKGEGSTGYFRGLFSRTFFEDFV